MTPYRPNFCRHNSYFCRPLLVAVWGSRPFRPPARYPTDCVNSFPLSLLEKAVHRAQSTGSLDTLRRPCLVWLRIISLFREHVKQNVVVMYARGRLETTCIYEIVVTVGW